MTPLRMIRLVAMRDFRERLQSRAFQISTAFTLLLVLGAAIVPAFFSDSEGRPLEIGAVGRVPAGLGPLVASSLTEERTVEVTPVEDGTVGEAELEAGEIDVLFISGVEVVVRDRGGTLASIVAASAAALEIGDRAEALGLTEAEVSELLGAAAYGTRSLEPDSGEQEANRAFAFVGAILLFISIVTYGQWILIGVIEEKTSRVVEVVLGAVRPHHLLAGKVLGIGLLAFAQLVTTAGLGLVAVTAADTLTLPSATGTVVVSVGLWFVLGFAFYATAYAAAGSLVSRQEEAQNVAFPLTILLTGAYIVAAASVGGSNPAVRIASLLPPFAPMTMPLQMADGEASFVEVVGSVVLMIGATYLLIRVAGRIYRGGLLRSGGKVRLRDAWRSAEV
ncbi:MAG: ABC transporter permease [Acidimicrobiia bacterium]